MSDSAAATRMPVPELVGVFGGTFDPIHRGHLDTVSAVREACSLDRVLFVPASTPPHRDLPGATAQQRLEMVALAIADYPDFVLDDREFQRTEPSYTFDTLRSLTADLQEAVCCFILGVDAFLEFESWHRWQKVLEMANFIVMERPGWQPPEERPEWWQEARIESAAELGRKRGGQVLELTVEPRAVSATEIRYGIADGADVSSMLPPAVWQYIREHRLYRNP